MTIKKDFDGTVVTSTDSGTFTPTYGKKKKKKDTGNSKSLTALIKWVAKREDAQQKDKMKKIKDKENNEGNVDEATPFTGTADLALPILNHEK